MRFKYQAKNHEKTARLFGPYKNAYRALRLFIREESNIENHAGLYQRYTDNVATIAKQISQEFFEMKEDFSRTFLTKDQYAEHLKMYKQFLASPHFYTVRELYRTDIEDENSIVSINRSLI